MIPVARSGTPKQAASMTLFTSTAYCTALRTRTSS